ncbi:MAG: FAD-dependent oxidoreductase [Ktedonobacterales bacterium]|nr:FAD-dependent oxidoreductase [Ktedonobacterales bacterium]
MPHLLIIGGSDAGISAALRAREVDASWQVTMVVADAYPNFSICGLPYFLSGEVADWHHLAHRTRADIEAVGIHLLLDHTATHIDPGAKTVTVQDRQGGTQAIAYDRLVIGTGATPHRPAIAGLDQEGVYLLHTMDDSFAVKRHLEEHPPQSAIIVGAGYIGLEMAEALASKGIATTLLQRGAQIHPSVDAVFGDRIAAELGRHGVQIVTGATATQIVPHDGQLHVVGQADQRWAAELVLVATGVQPATALARAAGVPLGADGALRVTRTMATTLPDVFAAGDCVETHHRLLAEPTYLPLGTTAHKQGRVAGENAVGGHRLFAGSVGTQAVKVCDVVVARTGLLEHEARAAGYDPLSVDLTTWDHKVYYPGARELVLRLTGDRMSGRVLGAQILGAWGSEVAKRIDIIATALYQDLRIEQLSDLDLSYTPPLSSPWDPIQMVAQVWCTQQRMR